MAKKDKKLPIFETVLADGTVFYKRHSRFEYKWVVVCKSEGEWMTCRWTISNISARAYFHKLEKILKKYNILPCIFYIAQVNQVKHIRKNALKATSYKKAIHDPKKASNTLDISHPCDMLNIDRGRNNMAWTAHNILTLDLSVVEKIELFLNHNLLGEKVVEIAKKTVKRVAAHNNVASNAAEAYADDITLNPTNDYYIPLVFEAAAQAAHDALITKEISSYAKARVAASNERKNQLSDIIAILS